VDGNQPNVDTKHDIGIEPGASDSNDYLAARLKQILATPGISDKDRKLVERNLRRLIEANQRNQGR
jgi:hypothetical protein